MISQIFVAIGVALVASVWVTGLVSTINAQSNMTGGNMTGNMSMPTATNFTDGGLDGDGGDEDGSDGEDGSN